MLPVVLVTVLLLVVAALCWPRMGPGSSFRVITEPTREEVRRHYTLHAAVLVGMLGLTLLSLPPLFPDQPDDGFVLEGGGVWIGPAFFFFLGGGGLLALLVSTLWIGGIVSRPKQGGPFLEGKAGAAAEGWGRRNPRGMLLVFVAVVLVSAPFTALASGRRVVGTPETLTLDGFLQLQPETVPWSEVKELVLLREVAPDGDREVTLRFELVDGRSGAMESDTLWPLSDAFLEHFEAFCAAHALPLRKG